MSNSKANPQDESYTEELSGLIKKMFHTIRLGGMQVVKSISEKDPKAALLLETHIQKIGTVENKIDNILQIQTLERDEFAHIREQVDICNEITRIVKNLQEKTDKKKAVIETKFPQNRPFVRLNKILFLKWILWCIDKIYRESVVIHVLIDVSYIKNNVVIRISPKRLSAELELTWYGIDWLLAARYFVLENGYIEVQNDHRLEIALPAVIQSHPQISEKQDEDKVDILQKMHEGEDLPTLSPIAVKIIQLAADEKTSAKDIAKIISIDPALTARVLKVVNSPFYGFANEITSISQAVSILGMNALRTLTLCISVLNTFTSQNGDGFDYHDFWQRSFASGVICKLTAQKLGLQITEESFIAGLTQNIGSLIFARYYPDRYGKLLKRHYQTDSDLQAQENESWGIDHIKLGYELFSQWKMPILLCHSILYHHTPEDVPKKNSNLKKMVTLVYLSDIASHVLYDENKGPNLHKLKSEYKALLNIADDEIDEIMEHVSEETESVAKDFNLDIEVPQDYTHILQNANIELARINLDYEQMTRELLREKKRAEKLTKDLQEANKLLSEEVITDGLTKLYNHRFFFELITKEFANAQRHGFQLSCIMLDIDHFKNVNDTFGHQVGDKVLAGIGKILENTIRQGDSAARYGGEEFAVILPNTKVREATMVAERIRMTVENTLFTDKIKKGKISISAGVAVYKKSIMNKASDLVERADQGVYMAKNQGRNRVITNK